MSYLDRQGEGGLASWIFSTDHKRVALLYLTLMTVFFWVAVGIGIVMRLKHLSGGEFLLSAKTYNALFTVHGVIMVFLFVIRACPRCSATSSCPSSSAPRTCPSRG